VPVYGRTRVSTGSGIDELVLNDSATETSSDDGTSNGAASTSRTRVLVG
jgi:hypothetical protein